MTWPTSHLDMQVEMKSNIKFHINTDGRTDVRDEDELTVTYQVTAVDARARTESVGG